MKSVYKYIYENFQTFKLLHELQNQTFTIHELLFQVEKQFNIPGKLSCLQEVVYFLSLHLFGLSIILNYILLSG